MTCDRARHLIDAFLTDDLSESDARSLAAHVRTCAACAAEMRGASTLVQLASSLPDVVPTPDFDERIYTAAIADRARRHEHRSWLGDLWTQMFRGAVRTTGTLALTIGIVLALGAAFVFAATTLVASLPQVVVRATLPPTQAPASEPAPTDTPTPAPSAEPTDEPVIVTPATEEPTPVVLPTERPTPVVTAEPTPRVTPTPEPTPEITPTPQPTPEPTATPAPSVEPTATPSPEPSPSPSPTEKPLRTPTPPPSEGPSPSP
jgi:hypothetical protein